jgi:hypothetical protein
VPIKLSMMHFLRLLGCSSSRSLVKNRWHKLGTEFCHSCLCLFCAKHKIDTKRHRMVQSKHNIGTNHAFCAIFVPGTKQTGTNQAQLFMSLKGEHKIGTKIAHNRHKINTIILAQHESAQTRTERHRHGT